MILLALGVPRMGKTQALMDFVGAHAATKRFFIVDRAGEWAAGGTDEGDRWRGIEWTAWEDARHQRMREAWREVVGSEPSPHKPWFADAPKPGPDAEEWALRLPPTGVYRFGWPWEGEPVAELVKKAGNTTYVDDELDLVALHEGWKKNPLRDFCHRGRHLPNAAGVVGQVHLLGAARRAQSLATDVTSLADQVFVFRVQGHRTLQRLTDDRILEEEEVEQARELPPYHFKLWQASESPSWGVLKPL